jgi:pantothenate kinase-related protein Tda10
MDVIGTVIVKTTIIIQTEPDGNTITINSKLIILERLIQTAFFKFIDRLIEFDADDTDTGWKFERNNALQAELISGPYSTITGIFRNSTNKNTVMIARTENKVYFDIYHLYLNLDEQILFDIILV